MGASDERRILLALFAALEADDAPLPAALTDDPPVLAVARRHRLTPLLSIRRRGALPPGLRDVCRRDHVLTTARNLALAGTAEECAGALAAAGVETIVLKGLSYERTLYPEPGARPTSDVDLLVRDRDRRKAFEVLDALGFEPRAAAAGFDDADYHEVAFRRGAFEVDLHLALAPYARCAIDYDAVWRDKRALTVGAAHAFSLAPTHGAVFHALHMAIDHFDVPGLYLIDLRRLLIDRATLDEAAATARAWRCRRPFETALALTAAFQPRWDVPPPAAAAPRRVEDVVARFGPVAPLPRPRQLARKFAHFDTVGDAVRYTRVQALRNVHELIERRVRRRSARARLALTRTRSK